MWSSERHYSTNGGGSIYVPFSNPKSGLPVLRRKALLARLHELDYVLVVLVRFVGLEEGAGVGPGVHVLVVVDFEEEVLLVVPVVVLLACSVVDLPAPDRRAPVNPLQLVAVLVDCVDVEETLRVA